MWDDLQDATRHAGLLAGQCLPDQEQGFDGEQDGDDEPGDVDDEIEIAAIIEIEVVSPDHESSGARAAMRRRCPQCSQVSGLPASKLPAEQVRSSAWAWCSAYSSCRA